MNKLRRRTQLSVPVEQRVIREGFGAPTVENVRLLARSKTEAAINLLAAIMYKETAHAFARVAAAKELLDRGWGKPVQPSVSDVAPLELVHRIERVIVHPDYSSAPVGQEARNGEAPVETGCKCPEEDRVPSYPTGQSFQMRQSKDE